MREIKPLTPEQQTLVEENQGLIGAFIRRYPAPKYIPNDDYYGEISMGLVIAASTWVPGGASFSTWSFHQFFGIRSRVIRVYLRPGKHEKQPHEDNPLEAWVESRPESSHENDLGNDRVDYLRSEFSSLNQLDREMVLGEESLRNISRRIGVSHTCLQSRKRFLLEKLRRKLRSVFSVDWCREEGFFRKGIDIHSTETDMITDGGIVNDCE